ncbi:NAD(P)/FAD-dependent oxidoreductase [Bacillus massiliglaciei]|uniref:NAD(P)/FAD-dependent oxidoreductase n=1 Tax=Bacillus massiliglaciei TaxID=1816693 RepID=UPI000AFFC27C|nr:NAD(P)/FAD-dependent oxidoreductase [Bacillus massiliglaciei]
MQQKDAVIIGGGIAGLQAAIQLGRYNHTVTVVDSEQGRSTITKGYHNILGYPDGVSGQTLRELGRAHAKKTGVSFLNDQVISLEKLNNSFHIQTKNGKELDAKTIFLATGITDRFPDIKNFKECLGKSIYICPDCDGYEINDKQTIIIGGGNHGAGISLVLRYFSTKLIYVNHDCSEMDESFTHKLAQENISIYHQRVKEVLADKEGNFKGVKLENGQVIDGEKGFTGFSGNKLNNTLARQIGIECRESGHVVVNPRTKGTNIEGVWAGGDLIAHSEQVTISMGDGSQAAIWMHKYLLGKPVPKLPLNIWDYYRQ